LHLCQRQVTKDKERVMRSVALSVVASLLLVRLYGSDEGHTKEWSLFKLKERFVGEGAQEAVTRIALQWRRMLGQY